MVIFDTNQNVHAVVLLAVWLTVIDLGRQGRI